MLLRRKGHPPTVVAVVFIATVILHISCGVVSAEEDLCDLQAWYTQAEADGAFVEPEPEVVAIEAEVKAILEAEGDKANVKCSVIAAYDDVVYGLEEEVEEGEAEGGVGEEEGEGDEADGLLDDEEGAEASEPVAEKSTKSAKVVQEKASEPSEVEVQKAAEKREPNADISDSEAEKVVEASDVKGEKAPASEPKEPQEVPDAYEVGLLLKEILEVKSEEAAEATEPFSEQDDDIPKEEADTGSEPSKPAAEKEGKEEEVVAETGEPDGKAQAKSKVPHDEGKPEQDTKKAAAVPLASTPPVDSNNPHTSVSNQELLAERLLAEQLRADYSGKMKDLEMQLLKMENKLLVDTADKHNNSNSFTKLENQLLKLENELLRINASFTILQAENAQMKATFGIETKGQYPALPDSNATMVSSLVDTHQSRITELSDVITKQSDVIKALDQKAELLEERNSELKETLVDQSDLIKNIIKRIEDIQETQTKQKTDQDKETKRLFDVIASVEDSRKDFEPKETDSGSRNLSAPDTVGGPVAEASEVVKSSDVELPVGSDGKEESDNKEKSNEVEEAIQKQPDSPKPEGHIEAETITHAKEKYTKNGPSTPIETVQGTEDKPPSEAAEPGSCSKPPTEKTKVKKTKKVKGTKKKKVLKKKKGGENKVVKKKRKVVKKGAAVPVPPPKYIDANHRGMKDCYDHFNQGRKRDSPQRIKPVGQLRDSDVFCDMRNGGWTVIMRRQDGSMDFYRNWAEYQRGFGGTYGDHWAGLELIHRLTNQGDYQLRVDLTDWNRNSVHAVYDLFRVEGEDQGYRLHISGYSGTAGDGFAGHSGMQFSTLDKDNDLAVTDFGGSCATRFHGAWWYNKCYKANPTGKYYRGGKTAEGKYDGVAWKPWTGSEVSLKRIEMKIRPKI